MINAGEHPSHGTAARWASASRPWITAALLVLLAALTAAEALRLGLGDLGQPGPGYWPLLISGLLFILGVAIRADPTIQGLTRSETVRLGLAVLLLVVFINLFARWGIFGPAMLVLAVWLYGLTRLTIAKTLIISSASAGFLHLIFAVLLGVL